MMMGKMDRVKNLELKEMGSIAMLKIVLEDTDDEDLKSVGTKVRLFIPVLLYCSFHRPCDGKSTTGFNPRATSVVTKPFCRSERAKQRSERGLNARCK